MIYFYLKAILRLPMIGQIFYLANQVSFYMSSMCIIFRCTLSTILYFENLLIYSSLSRPGFFQLNFLVVSGKVTAFSTSVTWKGC